MGELSEELSAGVVDAVESVGAVEVVAGGSEELIELCFPGIKVTKHRITTSTAITAKTILLFFIVYPFLFWARWAAN